VVEIYGEPAQGMLRFRFHAEGKKILRLYDSQGRLLNQWQGNESEGAFAPAVPAGLYWIRAVAGQRVEVFKVVL
jgi:hypothetical protein